MTASLTVWLCVATFLIALILYRVADEKKRNSRRRSSHNSERRFRFIELGKEREEFFIPGDKSLSKSADDYDSLNE